MAASSRTIKKIDASSVLQMCSSQVVTDLKSAVKELVENSLDANSKAIGNALFVMKIEDVKFFNSGLGGFEVSDDGHGIKEADFDIIAKRGTTSKIQQFDDIYAVKSLGFRVRDFLTDSDRVKL